MIKNNISELYGKDGNLIGVFISGELWIEIKDEVYKKLKQKNKKEKLDIKEPIEDWELFKKNWDFKYPYDFSVKCDICGNSSDNWELDQEKRFYLTAASLSGLVSFRCAKCEAKIVKKHFKDKITIECIPMKK